MKILNFPNNADEYIGAEEVMRWLHGRTSGVFPGQNNAVVTAVSGAMSVKVAKGTGWITDANGNGCVWWSNSDITLTIGAAPQTTTQTRIDRIVVHWLTTNYTEKPEIIVLPGTAATSPSAPALPNSATDRYISLAQVKVKGGAISLTATDITDERYNSSVCGLVTDGITIDTTDLNAKYLAAIEQMRQAIEEAWDGAIPTSAVTADKLAPSAVETGKIADSAVTTAKIAANAVTKTFSGTITTTWTGSAAPYTQAVTISGILAADNPKITPNYSTTNATAILQKEAWNCVSKAVTSANTITFTCFEDKPVTAIPIFVEVSRK